MTVTDTPTEQPEVPDEPAEEALPEPGRPIRRDPPSNHMGRADYGHTYVTLLEPLLDAEQFPYDEFYWVQRYKTANGATNIVSNLNRGKNKIPDPPEGFSWVFRSARCRNTAGDFIDESDLFAKLTSGQIKLRHRDGKAILPEHGPIPPGTVSLPEPEQDKGAYVGKHDPDVTVTLVEPDTGLVLDGMLDGPAVPNQPVSSVMPDHEPVVETWPSSSETSDLPF